MDDLASQFLAGNQTTLDLAVALLLGAIIGLERGWDAREQKSGERIAGIRTFALVGLLGGISAVLAQEITEWAFPVLLVSVVAMAIVAYSERLEHIRNFSITGMVGMVLTFCFGAVAVAVDPVIATAAAVVTAIILDNKEEIHGWVNKLKEHELDAALKLLLISVVMLPLLPNEKMGPGGVLNPREIWWMVVMIAYPLLSVYPQEILFRTFFFHRYRPILGSRHGAILWSAFVFGLAHLFFANWIAPTLTALGGYLFARTYTRSGSTLAAVIEHALWGDFLFTIGLGWYFYGGSIRNMAQAAGS